jgi:hypothetical protein
MARQLARLQMAACGPHGQWPTDRALGETSILVFGRHRNGLSAVHQVHPPQYKNLAICNSPVVSQPLAVPAKCVRLSSFVVGGGRRANFQVALQVSLFATTPRLSVITLHNTFANGAFYVFFRGPDMLNLL